MGLHRPPDSKRMIGTSFELSSKQIQTNLFQEASLGGCQNLVTVGIYSTFFFREWDPMNFHGMGPCQPVKEGTAQRFTIETPHDVSTNPFLFSGWGVEVLLRQKAAVESRLACCNRWKEGYDENRCGHNVSKFKFSML